MMAVCERTDDSANSLACLYELALVFGTTQTNFSPSYAVDMAGRRSPAGACLDARKQHYALCRDQVGSAAGF